ncbi:hypothetical protein D3C86_1943280 [compost metagenome]
MQNLPGGPGGKPARSSQIRVCVRGRAHSGHRVGRRSYRDYAQLPEWQRGHYGARGALDRAVLARRFRF